MKKEIEEHLFELNLDIRISKYSRFFDQKVQPDVLSAVSESILECCNKNRDFSINDVRQCDYSNELVTEIFNKPEIKKAENEYDKFFSQPIKMLTYAGILDEKKDGRTNRYTIKEYKILEYLSLRDRNAYFFLVSYLEKVLTDSGLWEIFNSFFIKQDKHTLYRLREKFKVFLHENTPIKGDLEPIRILNPLLNLLCFKFKKLGSKSGRVSEVNYNDLLYNRLNWRDVKKDKSISRQEFLSKIVVEIDNSKFFKYNIEKAKKLVKKIHPYSEVHRFSNYPATQAHHIFPASDFPEIADLPENIISLSPNQHFYRAHPNNNTQAIDKSYQAICLLAKLDSVEEDYRKGSIYYEKEKFIEAINVGFQESFTDIIDFEELKHKIMSKYVS